LKRLLPIIRSFKSAVMLTLTTDPSLFPDAKSAFLYVRRHRFIGTLLQSLYRGKYLRSRRYVYVVEFNTKTSCAHYHVLCDAIKIPEEEVRAIWDRNRPKAAGPVKGNRPPFGTVNVQAANRPEDVRGLANYVLKTLVTYPSQGFPGWVLDMGKTVRIRRYGTSEGLLSSEKTTEKKVPKSPRPRRHSRQRRRGRSHAARISECGKEFNRFDLDVDTSTGEVLKKRWTGRSKCDGNVVKRKLEKLQRRRRIACRMRRPSMTDMAKPSMCSTNRPRDDVCVSHSSTPANGV
jgi:hypothetical protein